MNDIPITAHFGYNEMTKSATLDRHNALQRRRDPKFVNIVNTPNDEQLGNLTFLCKQLEVIRRFAGGPMIINSAFRTAYVNNLVGGALRSLHVRGLAADIHCDTFDDAIRLAHIAKACNCSEDSATRTSFSEILVSKNATSWWLHLGVTRIPLEHPATPVKLDITVGLYRGVYR